MSRRFARSQTSSAVQCHRYRLEKEAMKVFAFLLAMIPSLVLGGSTLTVDGNATTQPTQWTADQLKKQPGFPTTQLSYQGHDGTPHHSTCIAMIDLLKAAGISTALKMDPKADPHTKHAPLRMIVTAKAGDGYAVVFSLAELSPELGNRAVWLALDVDDQPLSDRDAPVKLIVPDDGKPARWVHGMQRLSVDDVSPAQ
jgi:hypothetical protein